MSIYETCAICLEDTAYVKLGKRVVKPSGSHCCKLACDHVFHRKCIKKWYVTNSDGNACPCCRQKVKFRGVSFMYNKAILEYHKERVQPYYFLFEYDEIRYIYYDNPGTILFVNDVLACRVHFCFWEILNSLKRKSIWFIKRCV